MSENSGCGLPNEFCFMNLITGAKVIGFLCFLSSLIGSILLLIYLAHDVSDITAEISDNNYEIKEKLDDHSGCKYNAWEKPITSKMYNNSFIFFSSINSCKISCWFATANDSFVLDSIDFADKRSQQQVKETNGSLFGDHFYCYSYLNINFHYAVSTWPILCCPHDSCRPFIFLFMRICTLQKSIC